MEDDLMTAEPETGGEDGAPAGADPKQGAARAEPNQGSGQGKPAKPLLAEDDPGDDPPPKREPRWREDWRQALAGEDKNDMKWLDRYSTPEDLWKAVKNLRQRLQEKTQPKAAPGPDASPEEIAEYRKAHGIPEKPEEYKVEIEGIVPSEEDKPFLEDFRQFAHSNNIPPAEAQKYVKWYYDAQEKVFALRQQEDDAFKAEAQEVLREEWGADYRRNLNLIKNFLVATAPVEGQDKSEFIDRFLSARLADGRILGDDPVMSRWLAFIAREQNPGGDLLPAGTPNVGKGIEQRIEEIRNIMRTDREAYYRNDALQKEFQELLAASEKRKSRGL